MNYRIGGIKIFRKSVEIRKPNHNCTLSLRKKSHLKQQKYKNPSTKHYKKFQS